MATKRIPARARIELTHVGDELELKVTDPRGLALGRKGDRFGALSRETHSQSVSRKDALRLARSLLEFFATSKTYAQIRRRAFERRERNPKKGGR